MHGAEKSADFLAADEWIKREWPKIIAKYSPEDTYNAADETGLYFRAIPEHIYLIKNESAKGFKSLKKRVTVLCCVNVKGEKRDLLVIGKSKNPRCFKGVRSFPVGYYSNANAWITSVIFNDWLVKWDLESKQNIVLLVDNCTAHTNSLLLKNIEVIFLPANNTALIQPCDQGIIRTFKAHYRREMRAQIIAELDDIQDRSDASAVAKKDFPS
jgi:hypothetical protein